MSESVARYSGVGSSTARRVHRQVERCGAPRDSRPGFMTMPVVRAKKNNRLQRIGMIVGLLTLLVAVLSWHPWSPSGVPPWFGTFSGTGGCIDPHVYPVVGVVGSHVHCVADPLGSGRTVAEYDVTNSDRPYAGDINPRADLESPRLLGPGRDYYVSTSMYLPTGTPVPGYTSDHAGAMLWEIFGSPFGLPTMDLSLANPNTETPNHDHFRFGGDIDGTNPRFFWWSAHPVTGDWHSVIVHIKMDTTDAGYVQLWLDGVRQSFTSCTIESVNHCSSDLQTYHYKTLLRGQNWNGTDWNFLDINSYRSPCTSLDEGSFCGTLTTYHGAPAIGPTYDSVASTVYGTTGP
jgi:hypothetical protein